MSIPSRPLGLLLNVLKQLEMEVSYAYDDLVFVEHNEILLRMENSGEIVSFFFNKDLDQQVHPNIKESLIGAGKREGLSISCKGEFSLEEMPGEKINIHFHDFKPKLKS